jgi:hypothetical protein
MKQYHKKVSAKNRYKEVAKVLNGVLQLTERELTLFAILMYIDRYWPKKDIENKDLLSRLSRKYIMKELGLLKSNLSHYANRLKEKAVVILADDGKRYLLNPLFKIDEKDNKFEILFTLDFKKDKDGKDL